MFSFEGVREVCVRKKQREEVGLDLVELRFKVYVLSDKHKHSMSELMHPVFLIYNGIDLIVQRNCISG